MTPSLLVSDFSPLVQALNEPFTHPASNISFEDDIERSTHILDGIQTDLVASAFASIRQSQAAIRAGMRHVASLQAFLQKKQAKFKRLELHFKTLVAPIRRLPSEILQEIFMFVRANEDVAQCNPSIVAQVNKYWRRVALGTPRLWTTIGVRLQVDADTTAEHLARLAVWATRARTCPISLVIKLDIEDVHDIIPPEDLRLKAHAALVDIIETYASRLESLALRGDAYRGVRFRTPWFSDPTFSLPILKTLDIAPWGSIPASAAQELSDIAHELYQVAPAMERFMLFSSIRGKTPVGFSWDNLKALRCWSSTCHRNIFSAPKLPLEFLHIVRFDTLSIPTSPYPPLPNLTTLVLDFGYNILPLPIEFFPPLPALRHLILNITHWQSVVFVPLEFLHAWGQNLHYLRLPDGLQSSDIAACLKLTPNLRALRMPMLKLGSLPHPTAAPLPRLTHLDVEIDEPPDEPLKLIRKQLQRGTLYPVSTVTLFPTDLLRMSFAERVEEERKWRYRSPLAKLGVSVHCVFDEDIASTRSAYFREQGLFTGWLPMAAE